MNNPGAYAHISMGGYGPAKAAVSNPLSKPPAPLKGLIIRDPWITKMLNNEKPWEMRGSNTSHRGPTEFIKSGTGLRYGSADLVSTHIVDLNMFKENIEKHRIENEGMFFNYNQNWAWVFENAVWHIEPIPYIHPQGAVIWVNL